jgi:hypothetical protein
MPDGTSKYFGESNYVIWNRKDEIVAITLPRQAKVKIKFLNTDGSPTTKVSSFLDWITQTRPAAGEGVYPNEKGIAEIQANAGDIFNFHSIGFTENHFVFPTIYNFNVGNGDEVKEIAVTVRKGIKVFGNVFDADGKPITWRDQYFLGGLEKDQTITKPHSQPSFGIDCSKDDATGYEIYLPPGTYTFKISLRNEQKVKPEERFFDEQTVTIGNDSDNDSVRLDLKLHL